MTDKSTITPTVIRNFGNNLILHGTTKYPWLNCEVGDGFAIDNVRAMYGANVRYKGRMRFRSAHDEQGILIAIRVE